MTKRTLLSIIAVIALQVAVLVTMIVQKQLVLNNGTPIILETRPIDPRSLFRGDYVRLNYTISRLNSPLPGSDMQWRRHDDVFVVLEKNQKYWQAVSMHRAMPLAPDDQVVISGKVSRSFSTGAKRQIIVRYGIESYFVPEGEGLKIERPPSGEEISIMVAVDGDGVAGIKAIMLSGEPLYEERLF